MARELTLPYWHTFYANEEPGLGDKAAMEETGGLTPAAFCSTSWKNETGAVTVYIQYLISLKIGLSFPVAHDQ